MHWSLVWHAFPGNLFLVSISILAKLQIRMIRSQVDPVRPHPKDVFHPEVSNQRFLLIVRLL
jgi:hypothetical protein